MMGLRSPILVAAGLEIHKWLIYNHMTKQQKRLPVREVFLGVRATRKLGLPQPWKAAEPSGVRHRHSFLSVVLAGKGVTRSVAHAFEIRSGYCQSSMPLQSSCACWKWAGAWLQMLQSRQDRITSEVYGTLCIKQGIAAAVQLA